MPKVHHPESRGRGDRTNWKLRVGKQNGWATLEGERMTQAFHARASPGRKENASTPRLVPRALRALVVRRAQARKEARGPARARE